MSDLVILTCLDHQNCQSHADRYLSLLMLDADVQRASNARMHKVDGPTWRVVLALKALYDAIDLLRIAITGVQDSLENIRVAGDDCVLYPLRDLA